jgi:hypothetical protein
MLLKEDLDREPSPKIIIKDLRLSLTLPLVHVPPFLDLDSIFLESEINRILKDSNTKKGIFSKLYIL